MEVQLSKINPSEFGLDAEKVTTIEAAFMPKIVEREAIKEIYGRIITSEITPQLSKEAGDVRKKLVKVRTGIAEIHKTQKAYFLAAGRFVDAWKNKETEPIEQMEENLSQIETHFERLEAERIERLKIEREQLLSEVSETPQIYNAHLLDDKAFNELLNGLKLAKQAKEEALRKEEEARIEAERIAEEARIERERKEAEERDLQRKENERLKAEAEKREKEIAAERAKAEAEIKALEEKSRKEREAAEAKLQAEREAARKEAERIADEKAKIEAELRAKQEAELQLQKAKEEAEKKAKNAPDKEKLLKLSNDIQSIQLPDIKGEDALKILENVKILLSKVSAFIEETASNI